MTLQMDSDNDDDDNELDAFEDAGDNGWEFDVSSTLE